MTGDAQMDAEFSFSCRSCGQIHRGIPDVGYDSPHYYQSVPEAERARRAVLTGDTCIIDGEDHFIRGVLLVPIRGREESFGWGIWVSLSEANFERYRRLFHSTDVGPEETYFGWFSSRLPDYPDTLKLKTRVQVQPYPNRPLIELEPTEHPLAVEQREGIDEKRLIELLERYLHPVSDSTRALSGKKFKLKAKEIRELAPGRGHCFASDRITVDGAPVGYMYREEPDRDGDSGWRFLAGDETEEYMNNPDLLTIYDVNTICNYGASILPYLDESFNSAFERDNDTGEFVEVEFEPPED